MKNFKITLLVNFISLICFSQSQKLIGVWIVYFNDEKVSNLVCDVCPKWEFKQDHTMSLTKPNGDIDTTTWEVDENNMLSFGEFIKNKKGTTKNEMAGRKLKTVFSKSGNITEMRFIANGKTAPMVFRK